MRKQPKALLRPARRAHLQLHQPSPQPIDREISIVEKEVVEAAEAMPENKFDFSPEKLNLPGSDYKGVRTFGQQLKHVAASNYLIWSPITGEKAPDNG